MLRSHDPEFSEIMYGGNFWRNKQKWLDLEPSFNADRVETPVLFGVHNELSVPFVLPSLGALLMNKRPAEMLVYPNGGHVLTSPRQRLASLEATLDWMSFWLQDYQDS